MGIRVSSEQDQQRQAAEIHALAEQYHLREDLVRDIYEQEMKRFRSTAHIDQYLSLLCSRHVRELIRQGLLDTL